MKEYAPVVEQINYKFKHDNYSFVACIRYMEKEDKYKVLVYCQKCGHTHLVEEHPTRHNNTRNEDVNENQYRLIGSKFRCPHCGYVNTITVSGMTGYSFYRTDQAMIFKMADKSMAISLFKDLIMIYITEKGQPISHKKKILNRIIFSANGQTYVKKPYWVRSGKPLCKEQVPLRTLTYYVDYTFYLEEHDSINELEENGIIPTHMNLRNRFRNLTDRGIEELVLISNFRRDKFMYDDALPDTFSQFLKKVPKDINDDELWDIIITKLNFNISLFGKRFRRSFYKKPINTYFAYRIFQDLGMRDINSLHKFIDKGAMLMDHGFGFGQVHIKRNIAFLEEYMERFGEQAAADILASEEKAILFSDIRDMAWSIKNRRETYEKYMFRNLRKMHDAMLERKKYLDSLSREQRGIQTILYNDFFLNNHNDLDEEHIESIKSHSMRIYNETFNRNIAYSNAERRLEDKIEDVDFSLPKDTDSLIYAGNRLHNCVGNCYRLSALYKDCIIVLMKQAERFVGCIEINGGKIRQAFGPCNKPMKNNILQAYEVWRNKNGLSPIIQNRALLPAENRHIQNTKFYENVLEKVKQRAKELDLNFNFTPLNMVGSISTPF